MGWQGERERAARRETWFPASPGDLTSRREGLQTLQLSVSLHPLSPNPKNRFWDRQRVESRDDRSGGLLTHFSLASRARVTRPLPGGAPLGKPLELRPFKAQTQSPPILTCSPVGCDSGPEMKVTRSYRSICCQCFVHRFEFLACECLGNVC